MNTVEINSLKKYSQQHFVFHSKRQMMYTPMDVIDAWKEVCIQALEMRRVCQCCSRTEIE